MTHRKLRNRPGVHSIYLPTHRLPERARPGEYKRPSSDEYTLAVALKPLVIQRVLSFGFDVFFLDVDIALLRDPRPWLHRSPTADLQVSLNYDDRPAQQKVTGKPDLNTGVIFAKQGAGTLELVSQWATRTASRHECPRRPPLWTCGDQEQLTRLVRSCGWQPLSFEAAAELHSSNAMQNVRCGGTIGALQIDVLPPRLFASGQTSALWRGNVSMRRGLAPADVVTFHPNFGGFAGGSKKAMLRRLRFDSGGGHGGGVRAGWCLEASGRASK